MKENKRKVFSLLTALCMIFSFFSFLPRAYAAENPKIILEVPTNPQGTYDHLNTAKYKVFVKYLLDDAGNALNPTTGDPIPQRDLLPRGNFDEDSVVEIGEIEINGRYNELSLTSEDLILKGKLHRASFVIVPTRRAPGYLLDVHPDGRVAEVEFPKLAADGSLDPNQVITVVLKGNPAKKEGTLAIGDKVDPETVPIQGIQFDVFHVAKPKTVAEEGTADVDVTEWENLPAEVKVLTMESTDRGDLIIPKDVEFPEGKYIIREVKESAKEKGYTPITDDLIFYYFAKADKMYTFFEPANDSIYVRTHPEPQEADPLNGDAYFFNYKDINPEVKIVGADKSEATLNTISANREFGYKIMFHIPDDYRRYKSVKVEDVFDEKIKPMFQEDLSSVGGSDLSKEISVWYQGDESTGKAVSELEDTEYTLSYNAAERKLSIEMTSDQMNAFIGRVYGEDTSNPLPSTSITDKKGHVFVQFKAEVDGSKLEETDFEALQKGVENSVKAVVKRDAALANSGPEKIYDDEDLSNKVNTKLIRVQIKMKKTDGAGTALENAEFLVLPANDPNAEPLKPYNHAGSEPYTVKSGPNGEITAEKLPYYKEYFLKEIKAPAGYRLPKALFRVDNADKLDMVGNTGDAGKYDLNIGTHTDADQIVNVKKAGDITDTGTTGTLLFGLFGAGALGAGVILRKRKK